MRNYLVVLLSAALGLLVASCGGSIQVVESGTYKGTIAKVVPAEKEIYVTLEEGQKIELYFKEFTKLTRDGAETPFSDLAVGQQVVVELQKVGKRLDPLKVDIVK